MAYWLLKSEPDVFSLDDLQRKGVEGWDGVRNYQARNNLQKMKKGDQAFFYHSREKEPGVVGICRIVRTAYPDDTAADPNAKYFDPRYKPDKPSWFRVDVEFAEKLPRKVTLEELKSTRGLQNMVVVRNTRLSVQPVTPAEWKLVLKLARA